MSDGEAIAARAGADSAATLAPNDYSFYKNDTAPCCAGSATQITLLYLIDNMCHKFCSGSMI
jgi:hypothetical protein